MYVLSLVGHLSGSVESVILTCGKGPVTERPLANLRIASRWLYPFEIIINAAYIIWLFRSAAKRKGVIFNVHGSVNLAPIIAAKVLKVPVVWHFHETVGTMTFLAAIGKRLLQNERYRYVVVAGRAAEIYEINDCALIPGAVDTEFWRRAPAPLQRAKDADGKLPLRVIVVANLNPLKGIDLLLEAINLIKQSCEVIIVGAELGSHKNYAARLYRKSIQLLENKSVQFLGWQSAREVQLLLSTADIYVLPSRSEACPIALLEAMAMECVCVATPVGDVPQILRYGKYGILVNDCSASAIANGLSEALAMPCHVRQELGKQARLWIDENYSLRKFSDLHQEIYAALNEGYEG